MGKHYIKVVSFGFVWRRGIKWVSISLILIPISFVMVSMTKIPSNHILMPIIFTKILFSHLTYPNTCQKIFRSRKSRYNLSLQQTMQVFSLSRDKRTRKNILRKRRSSKIFLRFLLWPHRFIQIFFLICSFGFYSLLIIITIMVLCHVTLLLATIIYCTTSVCSDHQRETRTWDSLLLFVHVLTFFLMNKGKLVLIEVQLVIG